MSDMPEWFFIVNPKAGKGPLKHQRWSHLQTALNEAGIRYTEAITEYPTHAGELVQQALNDGFRHFAVVGGDGSLNNVLNGIFQQQTVSPDTCHLAVIPWGTGNDWAAYYKLPTHSNAIAAMFQQSRFTTQDVGQANYQKQGKNCQHYYANALGCGFDSYLIEQMGSGEGGRYRYLMYVVKCLFSYTSPNFRLQLTTDEGQVYDNTHNAMMLMACLGRYAGAGMILAPDAIMDDGLFEMMCINDMSPLKRAGSLPYLFNGNAKKHPRVESWATAELTISADTPMMFQCEGELVGELPVTVKLLPQAINILIP